MSVTSVRRALLAVLLVACTVAPSSASASSGHDATEVSIVRSLNKVRASHHLPKLRTNRGLARAADAHSRSMQRTNSFSHGNVTARVRKYVRTRKVGENLAWVEACDAAQIVELWMQSAPHRAIMLSRAFKRVGVGRSGSGACFVTADFASAH